jgi:hypothetical protein
MSLYSRWNKEGSPSVEIVGANGKYKVNTSKTTVRTFALRKEAETYLTECGYTREVADPSSDIPV